MSLWTQATTQHSGVQAGARRGVVTHFPLTYVKSKTAVKAAECGVFLLGAASMDLESAGRTGRQSTEASTRSATGDKVVAFSLPTWHK